MNQLPPLDVAGELRRTIEERRQAHRERGLRLLIASGLAVIAAIAMLIFIPA